MRDAYLDMYIDMTGIAKATKEKCWNLTKGKGCKSVETVKPFIKTIVHLYGLK